MSGRRSPVRDRLVRLLREQPRMTTAQIAERLGTRHLTVSNYLHKSALYGRLRRESVRGDGRYAHESIIWSLPDA